MDLDPNHPDPLPPGSSPRGLTASRWFSAEPVARPPRKKPLKTDDQTADEDIEMTDHSVENNGIDIDMTDIYKDASTSTHDLSEDSERPRKKPKTRRESDTKGVLEVLYMPESAPGTPTITQIEEEKYARPPFTFEAEVVSFLEIDKIRSISFKDGYLKIRFRSLDVM